MYGQTPITNANFTEAINSCLSIDPTGGLCHETEYGAMPDWDVSNVTDMSLALVNIQFPKLKLFSFSGSMMKYCK